MNRTGEALRLLGRAACGVLVVAMLAAGLVAPYEQGRGVPGAEAAAVPPPVGSRIPWQGGSWYLQGANVPWFNWGCDFGCGASGGVSDPAVRTQVEAGFGRLRDAGVHVARWWVFEGTAWQITRDASGAPAGIDTRVYADLDAALVLAERYDLYYELTLFHGPGNVPAAWLTDPAQRARLVAALTPLFKRYASHPRVLAFDVMNEPEWDIWNGLIAAQPVQALVREVAAAVHASGTAYVTVGSAMLDGLPFWKGLGLDFYQAHWYDYMSPGQWCVWCTDYAEVQRRYALDRPLIVGEFYAGPDVAVLDRLEGWYGKGYAGAYAWSLFSERTEDRMTIDMTAVRTFSGRHSDVGPRGAAATATPTVTTAQTATPTPTLVPTVTPSATPSATATVAPSATSTLPPTATLSAPASPSGLSAEGRNNAIRLSWLPSSSASVTYVVYRGTSPGALAEHATVDGLRFDDRSVTPRRTYYYAVAARTSAGESALSIPIPAQAR
ncbi:MAG TPA: hypothetical protein VFN74_18470 [Chloroflexota bacterium]|nr:hypothetical protein [Chloroflexota bacterium]